MNLHPEPAFGFTVGRSVAPDTGAAGGTGTLQVTVGSAGCVLFVQATGCVAHSPDPPPTPDIRT